MLKKHLINPENYVQLIRRNNKRMKCNGTEKTKETHKWHDSNHISTKFLPI